MNCKVCENTSTKNTSVSFFRFPKESEKCRDWAERCGLLASHEKHGTLRFYKSFRICSDHFDTKDIVFDGRKKRLLQSAVPLIGKVKNKKEETLDEIKNLKGDEIFKSNLCRLCATASENLTDIYGWKGRVLNLEGKLKYFPVMINKYDTLPLRVCHQCISKVNQFHDFILNCIKAETKLRIMLDVQAHDSSLKVLNLGLESQETSAWDSEVGRTPSETPNLSLQAEADDFANLVTHFPRKDEYDDQSDDKKVLQDNFLTKDPGCFCQDSRPMYTKTNQSLNHTNFIKEVDFSRNISFEHDYSNMVSRDQLLLEPEIQTKNFAEETQHPCDICLASFCSTEVLNSHCLTHSVHSDLNREFICEACNKVFCSRFEFDEHTSEHVEKNFACQICDKKFHKVAFLEKHSLLHRTEKSCDCFSDLRPSKIFPESSEKVSESFVKCQANKSSLHHEPHQTDSKLGKNDSKNRKRQFRKKLFKNRQVCLDHERSHAKDASYQCKQCGKTFRSKPSLRQHRSVHSDRRLHNCLECGMSFKRKDTLSNHLRIHTGERPFMCKVCGFAFKQRGDCMKHEKNHQKTCKADARDDFQPEGQTGDIADPGCSTNDLVIDISKINGRPLWDDEKNQSLLSYITITEGTGSLEDTVAGRLMPLNF